MHTAIHRLATQQIRVLLVEEDLTEAARIRGLLLAPGPYPFVVCRGSLARYLGELDGIGEPG